MNLPNYMKFRFEKKDISKYIIGVVVICAVFTSGFFWGKSTVVCRICTPDNVDFSLFWDAYNKLHENFISPDKITDQKVLYGAIEGMTKSLQDPYTDFFDPVQAKVFQQDLAGSFDGIGAEVGVKKGQLTIVAPIKDTPSYNAGLKSGDQIVKINGTSTSDISTDEAVRMIRGKKGTEVLLSIFREGWTQTKDFKIIRDTIKVDSVKWELKEGDVAYIQIRQFDQTLSDDFKKAANQILSSGAKKIVLDLRDDPGGYLEVCQDVAGSFLQAGQVVTLEDFGGTKAQEIYKAKGNGVFANYPTVVLINKGSASASEILAGALRDDRGITLIGEKSFGKGSVQDLVYLRDNTSFLKITIAKWLTPKGNSISEVGLTPDVKVIMTDADSEAKRDPQLDKALEILRKVQ